MSNFETNDCQLNLFINKIKNYEFNIFEKILKNVLEIISPDEIFFPKRLEYLKKNRDLLFFIKNITQIKCLKNFAKNIIIDSKKNTTINSDIFNFSSIEKVYLPPNIKSLSFNCFFHSRLSEIDLTNVFLLKESCFEHCYNLKKVIFSKYCFEIPKDCFTSCFALQTFKIHKNSQLISIGYHSFINCVNLKNINLPDSLTELEPHCFCNSGLVFFKFPRNIQHINSDIFCHCEKLKKIKIPKKFISKDTRFRENFTQELEYY